MARTIETGGVRGWLHRRRHGRLASALESARASLWIVPAACGLLAVAAAEVLARTDLLQGGAVAVGAFGGDAEAARSVLATIATASLTVLGVTLTITLAVLALTAQAYSPRAVRRFLRDPLLQVVVGVFVGSTVFSLTTLRQVQEGDVPALSVTIAIALVFLSLGLLIALFNHIAREIRVESIIAAIHAEGVDAVPEAAWEQGPGEPPAPDPDLSERVDVPARSAGHVTRIADGRLARIAADLGGRSEVVAPPGRWVREGEPVVRMHLPGPCEPRARRRAERAVGVATHRVITQDPEFALLQLADIAMRALSPSLNDVTTAREAIARGGDLLARLATNRLGSVVVSESGRVVHVRRLPAWEDLCGTLVDEPRRTAEAGGSVPALIGLLEALEASLVTDDPTRLEAIRVRTRQILDSAQRSVPDERDRATIAARAEPILAHHVPGPDLAPGDETGHEPADGARPGP